MSRQLPYLAAGMALVALTIVVSLRAQRTAPQAVECPHCPSADIPRPAAAVPSSAERKAATERPASASTERNFNRMPDGSAVPALPNDAPRRVRLGVALFRFAGAEGSAPTDRPRSAALEAARAAQQATKDGFRRAIAKADPGSYEDIGWVQRGVLEKRVEYAVFQLKAGDTYPEPLETPRGFWVVRRVK